MRLQVQYLALLSGLRIWHCRDPSLLLLWHRPVATVPIRPLAWESPCAGPRKGKKTKQTNKQKKSGKNGLNVNCGLDRLCWWLPFYPFIFTATPSTYGRFQARDQIRATATAAATPERWPTMPGQESNLCHHRDNTGSLTCCAIMGTPANTNPLKL